MALGSPNLFPEISPTSSRGLLGSRDDSESSRSDEVSINLRNGTAVTPISTFNESQPPHNPSPALPSLGNTVDLIVKDSNGADQVNGPPLTELCAHQTAITVNNYYNITVVADAESEGKGWFYQFFIKMEVAKLLVLLIVPTVVYSLGNKLLPGYAYPIAICGVVSLLISMAMNHRYPKLAETMQVVGTFVIIYIVAAMSDTYLSRVETKFSHWSQYVGYCLCVIALGIIWWKYDKRFRAFIRRALRRGREEEENANGQREMQENLLNCEEIVAAGNVGEGRETCESDNSSAY